MVTHQLQVERRTGKVRQSETDVLPLCYATNLQSCRQYRNSYKRTDSRREFGTFAADQSVLNFRSTATRLQRRRRRRPAYQGCSGAASPIFFRQGDASPTPPLFWTEIRAKVSPLLQLVTY